MLTRKELQQRILEIYERAVEIYEKIWAMEESELKKVYRKVDNELEKLRDEIISLYNQVLERFSPEKYPEVFRLLRGSFLNVLFSEKLLEGRKFWKYEFPVKGELPKPRRREVYAKHPFYGRTVLEVMRFTLSFIDAIEADKHAWIHLDILRVKIARPNVTYYFYVRKNWGKRLRVKHVPAEYKPSAGRELERYDYAAQLRSVIFLGTAGYRISTADFPSRWIPAPETKYGRRLEYDFSSIPVVSETIINNERRFVVDFSEIEKLPKELDLARIKRIFEERGEEVEWVSEWWE